MKKLLSKTLQSFTIYSLVVLAASVPAYYYLVDGIWLKELDEHNKIIADRTVTELERLNLTGHELSEAIRLWNKLQPGTNLKEGTLPVTKSDSIYTVMRLNMYRTDNEIDRFRGLKRTFLLNGTPYELAVETNVEETEETALAIAMLTLLFFLILVIGFLILNRRLSVKVWKPFRSTLQKVKTFNLNNQNKIIFDRSDTLEFEELNDALDKLIDQNITAYRIQKEFTENASHELQTPLAIIKNKLDLLLQAEGISERQYLLIEDINRALTRTARTNKNLLLLAKIENHQFDNHELINISNLLLECLQDLIEYATQKKLVFKTQVDKNITHRGNKVLTEILINNLLLNAIRHSSSDGAITLHLTGEILQITNSGSAALDSRNLFKRFARVSKEVSGGGLGLAIIHEICNTHEWKINYTFTENQHVFLIQF